MTANNLRDFPAAIGQPQPASVPYRTFKHVCDERNRLAVEVADYRQLVASLNEELAGVCPLPATPGETERGDALLSEAIRWQYADEDTEALARHWSETFRSVPRAVLCAYAYAYTCGVSDTLARRGQTARGWWTPGRVALLVTLLAIVAIVVVGR